VSDDGEEEVLVPSRAFELSADRDLVGVGSEEVEGEFSQDRDVFGPMAFAISGAIFVQDDIEDPVELVLDGPVRAYDLERLAEKAWESRK